MTEHLPQLLRASLWGVAEVGPGRAVPNEGSSQAGRLWAQLARGLSVEVGVGPGSWVCLMCVSSHMGQTGWISPVQNSAETKPQTARGSARETPQSQGSMGPAGVGGTVKDL